MSKKDRFNFRKTYSRPKLKNKRSPLSSTSHLEQPETLIKWKFESITNGPTDQRTNGPTDLLG